MMRLPARIASIFFGALFCGYSLAAQQVSYNQGAVLTQSLVFDDADPAQNTVQIFSETLPIDGDVEWQFTNDGTVYVATADTTNPLSISPSDNKDAQLIFNVAAGKTVTVEVKRDLVFTGNDTGSKPMHVSFRGEGTTKFRLPSGKNISFNGTDTVGTKVQVLMDQELAETAKPQVLFEKWSYEADTVNTNIALHSKISIGRNSSFGFVSQHKSGLPETNLLYGYGSVAFDPSNAGTGRMILEIARGASAGDFKDGAFNVSGSLITGTGPTGGELEVMNADFRTNVFHKFHAGIKAIVRVTNGIAQEQDDDWATHKLDKNYRRGLVVLNHNNSLPRFANNYDQAADLAQSKWFVANTVQTGFVLGNNGVLDVDHNCFIDYIAASKNASIVDGVHCAAGETAADKMHHASRVKLHNPSALIVDGNIFNTATPTATDAGVTYASQSNAEITLRGHAGVFVRCGASASTGSLVTQSVNGAGAELTDLTGTYVGGVIGKGTYDGNAIMVREGSAISAHQVHSSGSVRDEGLHALDVEGALTVTSHAGRSSESKDGYVNVPTVLLDHSGQEMMIQDGALVRAGVRPLAKGSDQEYLRYNTSALLLNDRLELFGTRLIHNDVSRDTADIPHSGETASPAIVGGELASLKIDGVLRDTPGVVIADFTGPAIYLYDSTVACHESLVSAGIHWVVREKAITSGQTYADAHNRSKIILYNRGNGFDTSGLGRVFQLGSRANRMADGTSYDLFTLSGVSQLSSLRDAFIDVYRQNKSADLAIGANKIESQLEIKTAHEAGVSAHERSIHVLALANRSTVNLGWAAGQYDSDGGASVVSAIDVDSRYKPWQLTDDIAASLRTADPENAQGYRFNPYDQGVGELLLSGDDLYITAGGRHDATGALTPANNDLPPRTLSDAGGIVFVNYGGSLRASGSSNDVLLNTIVARRLAADKDAHGAVHIPSDQLIMQPSGKIETYGYHSVLNPNPHIGHGGASIMNVYVPHVPIPDGFEPIKSPLTRGFDINSIIRSTDSITAPVTKPTTGMMELKSGDHVDQMQIAAATPAHVMHLSISGDDKGFARVREFVSVKSDPPVLGEGQHAALFLDGGARIGLGNRKWNEHSLHAWNQLGKDKVNLYAHGNAVVDLNDDIIITDKLPIVATTEFGKTKVHRLTFYSATEREIRVPENEELDLSSFGATTGYLANAKQIAFAGKVRLVLEPGAKIRFPSISAQDLHDRGPILYFNDDAKLIFEGNNDLDEGRWTDGLTGSDKVRNKILGCGQVWLNKNARIEIMDTALVGVEADKQTPITDVTVSIRREACFAIGDGNRAGGAFQVGNMVDGGGDGTNAVGQSGAVDTGVSFKLLLNGPRAMFHLDREAFFGLAAGTINKYANPNGDGLGTDTAWRIQSLHNVKDVTLDIQKGIFDHNQIFDGDDGDASVMAIGPIAYHPSDSNSWVNGGQYKVALGKPGQAIVRGGGNVVYIGTGFAHTAPKELSIGSTRVDFVADYVSDTGKYNLCSPDKLIRSTGSLVDGGTVVVGSDSYSATTSAVIDATSQMLAHLSMFNLFTLPDYTRVFDGIAAAGPDQFSVIAAHRNGDALKRESVTSARDVFGGRAEPREALELGYLYGVNADATGSPESYRVP